MLKSSGKKKKKMANNRAKAAKRLISPEEEDQLFAAMAQKLQAPIRSKQNRYKDIKEALLEQFHTAMEQEPENKEKLKDLLLQLQDIQDIENELTLEIISKSPESFKKKAFKRRFKEAEKAGKVHEIQLPPPGSRKGIEGA